MTPRRVWDPVVRLMHWALALCVALAWATTEWFGGWHQAIGWTALGIVAARTVWGFAGPRSARYARFSQFVRGSGTTFAYAHDVLVHRERRYLGHNPLGALMVIALMLCVAGLAFSGWLYTTDRFWGDELVERVHVALAWTVVGLAALHVAGVVFASLRHRENLVASMWTGMKRDASGDDIA